jgi:hypothetical protein
MLSRLLGSASSIVAYAPDAGAGAGAGAAGDQGGAGAGAGAGAASGAGADAGAGAGAGAQKTLAEGADPGAGAAAAAAAAAGATAFPDKWREMLAGDDKDALKDLAKYTDPKAVYKSLRSVQADISAGKLKAPSAALPANATDEQKAAWRQTNGLPDKAETYVEKIALGEGVVLSDADKPLVGNFAQMAMDKGWSQAQFNDAVGWFYQAQDAVELQRQERDGGYRTESQAALMTEWGPGDYKTNMNAVGSLLNSMSDDVRVTVLAARTPDGRLVGDTPEFNKWAAAHAREFNPAATLISPSEANVPKAIETEMASIEAVLAKAKSGDHAAHREYYGTDGKPGLDARWRELYAAQQKMQQQRGRAA